jgi:hypothetical protein
VAGRTLGTTHWLADRFRPQCVRSRFSNPTLPPTPPTPLTCNGSRRQCSSMLLNAQKRIRGQSVETLVRRGFSSLGATADALRSESVYLKTRLFDRRPGDRLGPTPTARDR